VAAFFAASLAAKNTAEIEIGDVEFSVEFYKEQGWQCNLM
jgi:hypothetical protein